ncbi:MAG: type II toxin-antitoxin system YafQ family toxin [Coriobacteriales bacterium]|nr:type II toxin-antitoxin system YafQ family toxin [Coriobacteriales bacterium]
MLRTIRALPIFERDVKKLRKKHFDLARLQGAITALFEEDEPTLVRLHDHALKGNWKGYRELHINADWLLIYQIERDELELVLVRSGSHDDLL